MATEYQYSVSSCRPPAGRLLSSVHACTVLRPCRSDLVAEAFLYMCVHRNACHPASYAVASPCHGCTSSDALLIDECALLCALQLPVG